MALVEFSTADFLRSAQTATQTLGPDGLLMLLQGYPRTVLGSASELAANLEADESWDDFSDIRIFGPAGEWHAFRLSHGRWLSRLWLAGEEIRRRQTTQQILWGSKTVTGTEKDGWILLTEASGASVRVPVGTFVNAENPAALELVEIIGFDENGLAGAVDVALRSIRPASKKAEEEN